MFAFLNFSSFQGRRGVAFLVILLPLSIKEVSGGHLSSCTGRDIITYHFINEEFL